MCDNLKLELSNIKAEYKLIESNSGSQQKEKKYVNITIKYFILIFTISVHHNPK